MTSHAEYGFETTATEVAAAFADRIKGRTVVVTGIGPASIGAATALAVASQRPAHLVLASRTEAKLAAVVADVARAHPGTRVTAVALDLASEASIRAAAAAIGAAVGAADGGVVDVLINNAGVVTAERQLRTAADGATAVDTQFYVNHLGVFLFTALLLPLVRAAAQRSPPGSTRIVNVSSLGHRLSPVRFSDYAFQRGVYDVPADEQPPASLPPALARAGDGDGDDGDGDGDDGDGDGDGCGYPAFLGYGQSKTANVLHARALGRRFRAAGGADVRALAVHPGTIETELSRSLDAAGRAAIAATAPNGRWKTLDQGAATTLVAAFDPALGQVDDDADDAIFLSDCQLRGDLVAAHATAAAAERLWAESERMWGMAVDV